MMDGALTTLLLLLDSAVRVATPLVLAAFAGLYCERAGVVDIGLEGKMLAGAFFAAATASATGDPWLVMVIQGLVILFAGALEHLFRPQVVALFRRRGGAGA